MGTAQASPGSQRDGPRALGGPHAHRARLLAAELHELPREPVRAGAGGGAPPRPWLVPRRQLGRGAHCATAAQTLRGCLNTPTAKAKLSAPIDATRLQLSPSRTDDDDDYPRVAWSQTPTVGGGKKRK